MSAAQVDALVGKVGEPTRDKRTIADLTVHSDPIPVLVPGVGLVGTAQAQLTDDGVIARITTDETYTSALLAGTLHAHIDTTHGKIVTGHTDDGTVLHDGTLRAITLTQAPNAWDGTWVKPVGPVRPETPELERMSAVSAESQGIGEFLDWLSERDVHLATMRGDQLVPYMHPGGINGLLATYFEIDLDKIERERRALLEYARESA